MLIIFKFLFFSFLLTVSYASSVCMADCISLTTPHPPSLYEQYCCNDSNSGKTIKWSENNRVKINICPSKIPNSCQRFLSSNCSELFKKNSSALSGYHRINGTYGFIFVVYCNVVDYINGLNLSNCSQVFQERRYVPSGYYTLLAPNGSYISQYCDIVKFINSLSLSNCSQIFEYSSAPSGYYTIQAPNGSCISVYCDMEGDNCDGKGGWMRVGYLNMSEPNATCPPGLSTYKFPKINYSLCDRVHSRSSRCDSAYFSTFGLSYSHVCGFIRGYQYGSGGVDGFYPNVGGSPSIEGAYVDGVSITHGSNPRHHIWTYVAGEWETSKSQNDCPCNSGSTQTTPQYVGNDYYCESGLAVGEDRISAYRDPLWDGMQCDYLETPCCTSPNMPWFVKSYNQSTTDDIELRMCTSEGYPDEATPVDIIELYVR